MHKQVVLSHMLKEECDRHQRLIDQFLFRMEQLPEGSLITKKNYYYRAVSHNGKREHLIIPEDLQDGDLLIQELQERRYISKALPILRKNLNCYKKALEQLQIYDPVKIKKELPCQYQDFDLTEISLDDDVDPGNWADESYECNAAFPEDLRYCSEGGQVTRSKAEADIATRLEQMGLSFRYKPILYLGKHKVSPDFGVLHPMDRQQIYWEHFGSMDNPDYANKSMDKLRRYAEYGYKLGDNLIITWESFKMPLTFQHINDRIQTYFF